MRGAAVEWFPRSDIGTWDHVMPVMTNTTTSRGAQLRCLERRRECPSIHQSTRATSITAPWSRMQWAVDIHPACRCSMILPRSSLPVARPEVRCKRLGKVPCNTLNLHLRPLHHVRAIDRRRGLIYVGAHVEFCNDSYLNHGWPSLIHRTTSQRTRTQHNKYQE